MAGRTSARSAATHDRASSPPKISTDHQSHSPVARRTRSASVELGGSNTGMAARRGKRGERQASVESIGSITSVTSSNNGRRSRKATRGAILYSELSMVAEDQDDAQPDDEAEEEGAEFERGSGQALRSPSPDGVSQMSGTTAITSFSNLTSHSAAEMADLDPLMAEFLPDLLISSYKIMDLLAPSGASLDLVESIVRELKVLGSRRAKLLKHNEEKFKTDRQNYGRDDYIQTSFILRKLLGTQETATGSFRPDAILYAANLATLVKDLLVIPKESQAAYHFLWVLDAWFPKVFVSEFTNNIQFGSSNLLDESSEMALEIRTQFAIVAFMFHRAGEEEDAKHPDQVLIEQFYDLPTQGNPLLADFEEIFTSGRLKNIIPARPNSEDQDAMIRSRVHEIRESFRQSDAAIQAGDLVDFEQLDEQFPWLTFLTKLVQWSRSRLDEITETIRHQGGVQNIVRSLIEAINNNDSQAEIGYDPYPSIMQPRELLPPAAIVSGHAGRSLYDKRTVRTLEKLKRQAFAMDAPPSNQNQEKTATSATAASSYPNAQLQQPEMSSLRVPQPSKPREELQLGLGDSTRMVDYDENNAPDGGENRRTSEYLSVWKAHSREKNKENRTAYGLENPNTARRHFIDRQPDARKIPWENDTQEDDDDRANPKRAHEDLEESDDEEGETTEDDVFQADSRVPDPSRRKHAPTGQRRGSAPVTQSSPKRPRLRSNGPAEEAAARRSQQEAEAALQASARQAGVDGEDPFDDDDDDPPSFTQVSAAAKVATAQIRQEKAEPQQRTPWSVADEQLFIHYIEKHGCSWATIESVAEFSHPRGQVALKDKARNMKVAYLKSRWPLPGNFDKIRLGKKEERIVKSVIPEFEGRS